MDSKKLHIIVDNTADMPADWLETYQIERLSMPIMLAGKSYYEHQNITKEFFYDWVNQSPNNLPKTGCNSPLEWEEKIKQVALPGDSVLIMPLASALSGNYNAALQAAKNLESYDIHVFDPRTGSSASGFFAREARLMHNKGITIEEIKQALTKLRDNTTICFVLDTVRFAVGGGRYGAIAKMAESVIPVKALVYFYESGEMKVSGIARSLKKATQRLSKDLQEKYKSQKVNLSVMYADIPEIAEKAFDNLKGVLNTTTESFLVNIDLTLSSHIGPGAIGFVVCPVPEY